MAQYEAHRPQRPRKKKKSGCGVLVGLLLAILIIAGAGIFYLSQEVKGSSRPESVTVEIPQGSSTADIAAILRENGAIGNSLLFRAYSKYVAEADGTYQYGTFQLSPQEGYDGIIAALQQIQQWEETVTVAFPEGFNAFQMGDALEGAGLCTRDEFIEALNTHDFDVDFLDQVSDDPLKLVKLDGFLFPATYEFFTDEDVDSIILRMLRAFQDNVLTQERLEELDTSGYSLEELVTLASIIQKEAANVEEMYNVSSVFTNRLAEGSPYPQLESCTTNNYIEDYINPYYDGNPPQEVLDAYDTYGKTGLPVGAIANPGLDAIDAALHPEKNTLDGTYYFFVTDVEYNHYYGRTYEEHLQNIEKAKAVNRTYGIEGLIS
jgi:UPF0755 protein